MAKFDWNQYPTEQKAESKTPSKAKFDWDQFPTEDAVQSESGGLLQDLAQGAINVARKVDSYTGAPVRKGIGAIQDGQGVGKALSETWNQFGQDPDTAPTATDIRKKAGIDLGDTAIGESAAGKLAKEYVDNDLLGYSPTGWLAKKFLEHVSPNDVVDFGIDAAADVTNLVPVAGAAKRAVKGGVELADMSLRGTGKALSKTGDFAAKAGKKMLSGATGVDEAQITKYLANHDRLKDIVDTRSGISAVKDDMDSVLEPLQSKVGSAKERVGLAKERRSEELTRLMDQQREAKEALRLAEQQQIGEVSARVSGDVQRLNKEVSAGSEKAFQILDQEGVRVPLTSLKADLSKGIKALEGSAVTDEQMAVVDLLKRYRERLDKFGKDIPGGEAKRLIQSLDREMKHLAPGEVGRLGREDQLLGILRQRIDAPLKASPAYAQQMKGVANDTRLLIDAEGMATESGAARALQAAQRPTGKDRADILRILGERQGQNYLAAVDRSTLPEYQKLKGILQRYRAARNGAELKAAQAELTAAVDELAPFKGIAPNEFGKSGSEALIRNQIRPKTAGLDQEELVKSLDQKFGKNYSGQIDDLRTIAAFDKEFTRGSANNNFWTYASAAGGFLLGGATGGAVGGGMGALFGRMVIDRFGPNSARMILDQIPKLKRLAPADWVKQLQVPPSVKAELLEDLKYVQMSRTVRGGTAAIKPIRDTGVELKNVAQSGEENSSNEGSPVGYPAPRGADLWAKKGLEKLGISDPLQAEILMGNKQNKQLLIEASDLPAGSKRLEKIKEQLSKEKGKRK